MNQRKRMLAGLDAEIRDHIERETQLNIERGMAPESARRAARLKFGNVELAKEDARAVWTLGWLEGLRRDLAFGLRLLRRSPGFAAVAILTLALGIGANTAIFSAVNGILLRPLPYAHPSRLVTIQRQQIAWQLSLDQLAEIRADSTALEHLERYSSESTFGEKPISTIYATDGLFSMLGVKPLLGRPILPEDMQPGNDRVAVLSYHFWMDEYGGDRSIVGRKISEDHQPYTVIGVMPQEFGLGIFYSSIRNAPTPGLGYEAMWLPRTLEPSNPRASGYVPGGMLVGRLKKGATLQELNAQLQPLSDRFAAARFPHGIPPGDMGLKLHAARLSTGILPDVRSGVLTLFGAVGFVLLMACVSVASLLVARSWTRQQELTIRKALGATRVRIVRQLLSETLLLALAGGALGVLVAVWGIHILRAMAPPSTPRLEWVGLDANVLLFSLGISLLVAVLVGLAPALQASSGRAGATLAGGPAAAFTGAGQRHPYRLRSALVVVEVLLAVILVVGGALMARSFYKLVNLNTIPKPAHVLSLWMQPASLPCGGALPSQETNRNSTASKSPSGPGIPSPSARGGVFGCTVSGAERLVDGIRSLGGVLGAGLALAANPFGQGGMSIGHYPGSGLQGLYIEGIGRDQLPPKGWLDISPVTPGYFAALGMRLVRGRDFRWSDSGGPPVAIVSQGFARTYLRGNPIGQHISTEPDGRGMLGWREIVGVVSDVRNHAVKPTFIPPSCYVLFPGWMMMGPMRAEIVVRTATNPLPLVPAIERTVRAVNPTPRISHIETVDQMLAQSSIEPRFNTLLLGSFGALGLLLAIVGVYGVISYAVVQRTHEIGVRMALGAQRADILGMVLREGMLLAVIGVVLGIFGALAVTRGLRNMLFEVTPSDPATFAAVAILLLLAAFLACWIPARRAMRVDPTVALRYE